MKTNAQFQAIDAWLMKWVDYYNSEDDNI